MPDTCTMPASCTISGHPLTNQPGDPLVACGEPAIAVIVFACVHEHMHHTVACAGCAVEVQQCADVLVCGDCEDGPHPHECPQVARIRWLEGSHA